MIGVSHSAAVSGYVLMKEKEQDSLLLSGRQWRPLVCAIAEQPREVFRTEAPSTSAPILSLNAPQRCCRKFSCKKESSRLRCVPLCRQLSAKSTAQAVPNASWYECSGYHPPRCGMSSVNPIQLVIHDRCSLAVRKPCSTLKSSGTKQTEELASTLKY